MGSERRAAGLRTRLWECTAPSSANFPPTVWIARTRVPLYPQGLLLYEVIPNMEEDWLRAVLTRFGKVLRQRLLFTGILSRL